MENNELTHWGIKGMKWGVRRYQTKDGKLTPAGKKRYDDDVAKLKAKKAKVQTQIKNKQVSEKAKARIDKLKADIEAKKKKLKGEVDEKEADKVKKKTETEAPTEKPKTETTVAPAAKPVAQASPSKDVKSMSKQELQDAVDRIRLEQQYSELTAKPPSKGAQFVKYAATAIVVPAVTKVAKDFLQKKLGVLIDGIDDKSKKQNDKNKPDKEDDKPDKEDDKPGKKQPYEPPTAEIKPGKKQPYESPTAEIKPGKKHKYKKPIAKVKPGGDDDVESVTGELLPSNTKKKPGGDPFKKKPSKIYEGDFTEIVDSKPVPVSRNALGNLVNSWASSSSRNVKVTYTDLLQAPAKESKIKALRSSGHTYDEIADQLGVSTTTIAGLLGAGR